MATSGDFFMATDRGKQRATDPSGLVLMGARLYNPFTGQFTGSDPVYGGNSTAYSYPQDPIGGLDLTGEDSSPTGFRALWKSCRGAGGSRKVCGKAVDFSIRVASIVEIAFPKRPWKKNAIMHFMWQAGLTIRFGRKIARAMAAGHEKGTKNKFDSDVDVKNNAFAQRMAPAVRRGKKGNAFIAALFNFGVALWKSDLLYTGRTGRVRQGR